jgi:ankyrin repeat protein
LFADEANNSPSSIPRGFQNTPKEASLEIILLEACIGGRLAAMRFAFEHDADPIHKFAFCQHKLLSIAAQKGYIQIVELLLAHPKMSGYSTPYSNFQYYLNDALCCAARGGWLRIAALLVEHGAQINRKRRVSASPWVCAVEGRQLDLLRYLIEQGAEIQDELVQKQLDKDDTRQYKAIVELLENNITN